MTRLPDLPRAATLATRVLIHRRVKALPVDPLAILRACRDTRVYTAQAAGEELGMPPDVLAASLRNAEACTFRLVEGENVHYIIVWSAEGNPARTRFTLAHELGHRLLGHTGADLAEETEADCFASHLLCPAPVVRAVKGKADADMADRLAEVCYVSHACAKAALRRGNVAVAPELRNALAELLGDALQDLD